MIKIEIERKFHIDELPSFIKDDKGHNIEQGYLFISHGEEIRIRSLDSKYYLTVKKGSGLERRETEIVLTRDQFFELWPLTEGRRIEKIRHPIPAGEFQIELDVYKGDLKGLITAEVEFSDKNESRGFTPPPWFGLEVTNDERYKNKNLALKGSAAFE
ncbi:CYTH domain-containing protein [Acidobacteriota bacterium]